MKARLIEYLRLTRFDRPIGALLLLWPTLWALWLAAAGKPDGLLLVIFIAGVFVMRALGCVVNDIVDRKLDAQVARTRDRPLAAGRISVFEAVCVGVFFLLVAFFLWLLLPLTAKLWAFPALALAMLYPFSKRVFAVPQVVLGLAFSFGIPMAYAAVNNAHPPLQAAGLFFANFLWVLAYDTIYALADRDDDIKEGTNSSAIWLGDSAVKIIALCYAAAVLWLSFFGLWFNLGILYQVALLAAMILVFRLWRLFSTRQPAACINAFHLNNWFGAFVFAGFVAAHH